MNNRKSPILPSLILVITLLLAVFYLKPLIDQVDEQDLSLVAAQEENDREQAKLKALQAEKAQVDILTPEEVATLDTKLPREVKQDEVVRQIETILATNLVVAKSITFTPPIPVNNELLKVTTNLVLTIPAQGTIPGTPDSATNSAELAKISTPNLASVRDNILNIVKSFEANPRLFSLKGINIVYGQDNLNLTISLEFYFQK